MDSRVIRFGLGGLRVFAEADFVPGCGVSWLVGANGAGKTSVVEAAYVLGHGRSFRAPQMDALVRCGSDAMWVFAAVESGSGLGGTVGVRRGPSGAWELRCDGETVSRLSDIARRFPVLCFEPGAHQWIAGPSERRRRLLDWGAFHVEHSPAELWSEYQRALRQRNAALRAGDLASAVAWEPVLCHSGDLITRARAAFHERWIDASLGLLRAWSGPLASIECAFRRGWGEHHESLEMALSSQRERDLGLGYTYAGPHRADLALRWQGGDARDRLSRGQAKMLALALLLGMSECFRVRHGSAPLLLLDDLCSELDAAHVVAVLTQLREHGSQAWITGVERPDWAAAGDEPLFHVEQGRITPLI